MNEVKKYIIKNKLGKVLENKSFKDYTTLKVGGRIRLVYMPNTVDNFVKFYNYYQKLEAPMFVIGAGSNVLASDKPYDGVVVSFSNLDIKYMLVGDSCIAYPGCSVVRLAYDLARLGYTNGEFLSGIPATIGGSIYMNAGANGSETKDVLISVKLMDKSGVIKTYLPEDLKLAYRKSILQDEFLIVLEAKLKFKKEEHHHQALARVKELQEIRRKTQPIDKLSAGCTFQNPKGYSAWQLIDQIGFRGYSINQAQVSQKHSNFLINNGNATSSDMMELIVLIQKNVKDKFNIDLKCEWILVNFD